MSSNNVKVTLDIGNGQDQKQQPEVDLLQPEVYSEEVDKQVELDVGEKRQEQGSFLKDGTGKDQQQY